jgi:hypothetical protein
MNKEEYDKEKALLDFYHDKDFLIYFNLYIKHLYLACVQEV